MVKESDNKPCLAIVVPCYNESPVLEQTTERLLAVLEGMSEAVSPGSRILYVDDGSHDATWDVIAQLHGRDRRIAGISLANNSGHQNALMAGLATAARFADLIVTIDADLQDDETVINDMVRLAQKGNDIVYGIRRSRASDTWFKRTTAQSFYRIMSCLGAKTVYNHADYRLMTLRAARTLLCYEERNLFLRGLIPLLGYRTAQVNYDRKERQAGESKYPLAKMLGFAFEGITSFSMSLVHMVLWLGILFLLIAMGISIWVATCLLLKKAITGWASLILSVWFCSGCILIGLGIVGEYVGKIYMEVKRRPRYNIKDERL
ncbi:MAG: glycosyltransferase family 2 protein [Prevotellaceae bacterium]|nr:glycosyltransferase family 2 protein [Prevotellaceae bacterium]